MPKFYLRRFSNSERRTLVLARGGERRLTAVKRAAGVSDFYAIDDEHGETSQDLEKAIGPIETDGARVMRTMLGGAFPRVTATGWSSLATSLCSLCAATPSAKRGSRCWPRRAPRCIATSPPASW